MLGYDDQIAMAIMVILFQISLFAWLKANHQSSLSSTSILPRVCIYTLRELLKRLLPSVQWRMLLIWVVWDYWRILGLTALLYRTEKMLISSLILPVASWMLYWMVIRKILLYHWSGFELTLKFLHKLAINIPMKFND